MIKRVRSALYAHKSNIRELKEAIPEKEREIFSKFILLVQESGIDFDVVKYDGGNVTLITSPDWDTAHEPVVGICKRWKAGCLFDEDGRISAYKEMRNFRQVYHNKWQFVSDGYSGFDIKKAKRRTKEWNSLPGLDKKRIGNKAFWEKFLLKNGMK